jgi:hypothetical protein
MAFHQVSASSLTPSRPAPQAPQRKGTSSDSSQQPLYSTPTTLATSGYGPSFTFTQSSSASSYAPTYTGIGGTPGRSNSNGQNANNSQIVRSGPVSVKEDGTFASWIWKLKWLVLKEQTLTIHKNEVSTLTWLCRYQAS